MHVCTHTCIITYTCSCGFPAKLPPCVVRYPRAQSRKAETHLWAQGGQPVSPRAEAQKAAPHKDPPMPVAWAWESRAAQGLEEQTRPSQGKKARSTVPHLLLCTRLLGAHSLCSLPGCRARARRAPRSPRGHPVLCKWPYPRGWCRITRFWAEALAFVTVSY